MAKRGRISPMTEDEGPDLDPEWIGRVREKLVRWYEGARRDLPWRLDRDPYRVFVSEMMLVQTTVTAVIPYFERFVGRFPTFSSLAEAEPDDVLKHWEGLGYYRRARQLHEAARRVVAEHGGVMPVDPEQLRDLPGIGRYIVGAVLSFAHGLPAPILEANTQRVAARWLAWRDPIRATHSQARLWRLAERVVSPEDPGTFNQAFMELGALICTPRSPLCLVCPVAEECRARSLGLQDAIPGVAPKAPAKESVESCVVVEREGKVLAVKRGPAQLWESFWEFPTVHVSGADPAARSFDDPVGLEEGLRRLTGIDAEVGEVARTIRYGVTTHKVQLQAHLGRYLGGSPAPGPRLAEAAWMRLEDLAGKTMSAPSRRLADWLKARS